MNIQEFLGQKSIDCEVLEHLATYDAQRMAEAVHVSGHHVAKTVLLRVGTEPQYAVAVLPASHDVDFEKTCVALDTSKVELATEVEMSDHCPDCEIGALPPFGSHYGMRTVVDESLTRDEHIVFEGTTHREAIRMRYADFEQLENPIVAPISGGFRGES